MAGKSGDYHRGEMDIHEQARTYTSFLVFYKWCSLALAVGILFFSLWFAVGVGFIASAVSAAVLAVLGVLALKDRKKPAGH
jgi:1,4-dihydroxy-2-naphthoate octaprenyltransferase